MNNKIIIEQKIIDIINANNQCKNSSKNDNITLIDFLNDKNKYITSIEAQELIESQNTNILKANTKKATEYKFETLEYHEYKILIEYWTPEKTYSKYDQYTINFDNENDTILIYNEILHQKRITPYKKIEEYIKYQQKLNKFI